MASSLFLEESEEEELPEEEVGRRVGDRVPDGALVGAEVVVEIEQVELVEPSEVPQVEVPEHVFEVLEEQQVFRQP
jgi:hypothetical protein